MKKLTFLILFVFGFAGVLAGFSMPCFALADISSNDAGNRVEISSFEDLQAYVNTYATLESLEDSKTATYNVSGQTEEKTITVSAHDEIVLTSDISFGANNKLSATIGTSDVPFCGTFDGQGYRIVNFNMELPKEQPKQDETSSLTQPTNQYVGLFGCVEGQFVEGNIKKSTLKNVAFSGNITLKVKDAAFVSAGVLAGQINYTNVENVQIASESLNFDFGANYSINYGSLVGTAVNSSFNHILVKNTSEINFKFVDGHDKTYTFGGLIGKTDNAKLSQVIVAEKFKNSFDENNAFTGTLYFGGLLGNILSGEVVNVAIENEYSLSQATVGEVAAIVASNDISYVYYKGHNLPIFANNQNYDYRNKYVLASSYTLSQGKDYFTGNNFWSRNSEYWDFDKVWYFESDNSIYLQNFYSQFSANITISKVSNVSVLEYVGSDVSENIVSVSGKYGNSKTVTFTFVKDSKNQDMKNFFDSIAIVHNNLNSATITFDEKGKASINIENEELYDITENEGQFNFIIKSLNFESMGEYFIRPNAKTFAVNVVSRLVTVENDVPTEDPSKMQPGYVSYNATQRLEIPLNMDYGDVYTFTTTPKQADSPYASFGWWFDYVGDKKDEYFEIMVNGNKTKPRNSITVVFGGFVNDEKIDNYQLITEECTIYADYTEDACEVLFSLGDGIARIGCGGQVVEESIEIAGQGLKMPRQNADLRLDIYVKENYNFKVEDFVEFMNIYKGTNSLTVGDFCKEVEEGYAYLIDEGLYKYQFSLDMTKTDDNWKNSFTVNTRDFVEPIKTFDLTWLWITLGIVGGLLLIGGIVFLIVFLVRRRGGGFGGGSAKASKPKKSDYKKSAMY